MRNITYYVSVAANRRVLEAMLIVLGLGACATTPPGADRQDRASPVSAVEAGAPLDLTGTIDSEDGCAGVVEIRGGQLFLALGDGALVTHAPMTVRVDGARRAFHPDNFEGGAIQHRCNAGEVHLPNGGTYEGASSVRTCTERFERDAAAIEASGWDDPSVGAIRWHAIAADGSAPIGGTRVPRVRPLIGEDGFYVSQTALTDDRFAADDRRRYADAATLPYAAVRSDQRIALGSYGVALRTRGCPRGRACKPVPFVVADYAPSAGAGSLALSYETSGLDLPDEWNRQNRYRGQAGEGDVLTVFFTTPADRGGSLGADVVKRQAAAAFEAWGGEERLYRCRRVFVPELNGGSS